MKKPVSATYVGPIIARQESVLVGVTVVGPDESWSRSCVLELPPECIDELMVQAHAANRWAPAWQAEELDSPLF